MLNLTPHKLNILDEDGNTVLELDPSGTVARVDVERDPVEAGGELAQAPLYRATLGDVTVKGDGVSTRRFTEARVVVVSSMVGKAVEETPHGSDGPLKGKEVVSPGELVRDDEGKPVGARGFDYHGNH